MLLVQKGLARSREEARLLILEGRIRIDSHQALKPGSLVPSEVSIHVAPGPRYVSRGGYKLAHALRAFAVPVADRVAADVGASTGGFTDCLLQHGARKVFAIDVGYGQLAWKLRQDPRVVVMERTNVRYLATLPEPVDLVTIDVSFISLRLVLPVVAVWLKPDGNIIALVKPQFEAGREQVGKGGVVKDVEIHRAVLRTVATYASDQGLFVHGVTLSPLRGPAGNREFFLWLKKSPPAEFDLEAQIEKITSQEASKA